MEFVPGIARLMIEKELFEISPILTNIYIKKHNTIEQNINRQYNRTKLKRKWIYWCYKENIINIFSSKLEDGEFAYILWNQTNKKIVNLTNYDQIKIKLVSLI